MALNIVFGGGDGQVIAKMINLKHSMVVSDDRFMSLVRKTNKAILKTDFAKDLLKATDGVIAVIDSSDSLLQKEVKLPNPEENSVVRTISAEHLSGGAKQLLTIMEMPDRLYHSVMGENMAPFIERAASQKDIYISLSYWMPFTFQYIDNINLLYLDGGRVKSKRVHSWDEYKKEFSNFLVNFYRNNMEPDDEEDDS